MDDFWWLLRGVAIGLAVAIPVGPIALLCMRRTLGHGFAAGFATGVGAAGADLFYSSLAAFGMAAVENALIEYRTPLSFVGGLFLIALAGWTALHRAEIDKDDGPAARSGGGPNANSRGPDPRGPNSRGVIAAAFSGFVLTASNPLTVIGFVAIFAGFGVGAGLTDRGRAVILVGGVLAGSILWWLTLNAIIARIRHYFSSRTLQRLNLLAAALIAAFGAYELIIGLMAAAPWLF